MDTLTAIKNIAEKTGLSYEYLRGLAFEQVDSQDELDLKAWLLAELLQARR